MNRVMPFFVDTYRQVKAEETFQTVAIVLAEHLTVDRLRGMAAAGVGLLPLMDEAADLGVQDSPEARYLAGLFDGRLLEMLDEAIPEHAAVLRENPEYTKRFLADLRNLVGGKGR